MQKSLAMSNTRLELLAGRAGAAQRRAAEPDTPDKTGGKQAYAGRSRGNLRSPREGVGGKQEGIAGSLRKPCEVCDHSTAP